MKHILEGLQNINASYETYAREMEELLMGIETTNQAHEETMNAAIDQVCNSFFTQLLSPCASRENVRTPHSELGSCRPKSIALSPPWAICGRNSGRKLGEWRS